jgi:ABC-type uncharacterized transport system auxiliary subunit
MLRNVAILALVAALSACGVARPLKPLANKQLPVAPVGRETRPTADELLKVETQAAPARNIELRAKSEDRKDDPFDLPPK